jgi:hypothetical protein
MAETGNAGGITVVVESAGFAWADRADSSRFGGKTIRATSASFARRRATEAIGDSGASPGAGGPVTTGVGGELGTENDGSDVGAVGVAADSADGFSGAADFSIKGLSDSAGGGTGAGLGNGGGIVATSGFLASTCADDVSVGINSGCFASVAAGAGAADDSGFASEGTSGFFSSVGKGPFPVNCGHGELDGDAPPIPSDGGRSVIGGLGAFGSGASRFNNRMLPVWLNVRTGSASAINCSMFFTGSCVLGGGLLAAGVSRAGGRSTTPCTAGIVLPKPGPFDGIEPDASAEAAAAVGVDFDGSGPSAGGGV